LLRPTSFDQLSTVSGLASTETGMPALFSSSVAIRSMRPPGLSWARTAGSVVPSGSVAGEVVSCQTGATSNRFDSGSALLSTTTSQVTNDVGGGVTPVSTSVTSTG